jgi:hypothetical protein
MPRVRGTDQFIGSSSTCFDCGEKFRMEYGRSSRCLECAAKISERFVVYDRDKGVGSLPANLKGKT